MAGEGERRVRGEMAESTAGENVKTLTTNKRIVISQ